MKHYRRDNREDRIDFQKIAYKIDKGDYRYLGKGSGRTVYDLGNGFVVKEARNKKGTAQSEVEYRISMMDDSGLFAKVAYVSEGYRYLVMDKADSVKDITIIWDYFHVRNNSELYRIRKLQDLALKYNLVLRDFGRSVNWGQIKGEPVIIDYGFTRQVRRRYY